ncbi:MAG TPA: molybdopterin-dependent oxidoreductase [Bacteroidales bacterium]|nr:molybdopterin-dependent oxidoreductase [Bacteroidales bacterium]
MEEFITACPRNCYSTCTFRVRVENNIIREILPYPGNLATPEGPCVKGLAYTERTHSQDRINHPLLKTNGGFRRISTNEAHALISEKLSALKDKFGPHSILWYKGSGMSGLTNDLGAEFWKAFGGATTTYGNLCWPAGLEAVRLTLGSVKHNVPWDLKNAKTIIIWGKNPAETNIQEISFIADARINGCKVVVIDPVQTPTADKADMFFSPVPGTDAAFALAMAGIIIQNGYENKEFINKYVSGFDKFRENLKITPEQAAEITGIPPDKIRELAHLIGTSPALTIIPGYGLQRHTNGGQTIRAILSLAVITGNIGKTGAGFNFANLQSYIFDEVKEPLSYYPDEDKDAPFRRSIPMARLGKGMLEAKDPEIKAIWVERGNPVLQAPDSYSVRNAISKLLFRVVIDQFMTDTAEMADIILPAKDIFEYPDIIGSYWSPYVQYKPAILKSPGEVMCESEIYYHMAASLGLKTSLPEPGISNLDHWLEQRIKGVSELTMDDLRKGPVQAAGIQEIAYEDMVFETASGKIELYSDESVLRWNVSALPEYVPVKNEKNKEHPLRLLTPNAGNRIHSQFGNLQLIKNAFGRPAALLSIADASVRKIQTGQRIKIFNSRGIVLTTAQVSSRIPEGIIVLPNGIWMNEGGGGNFLIEGIETDMGFGAAFHDTFVETELSDEQ